MDYLYNFYFGLSQSVSQMMMRGEGARAKPAAVWEKSKTELCVVYLLDATLI